MHRELLTKVAAEVSRSFYLTLRLLPGEMREAVTVAYLLARATDTVADAAEVPAAARLTHLHALLKMITDGTRAGLVDLQREIRTSHKGEQRLLLQLDFCLHALERLDETSRSRILTLLVCIVSGQELDVRHFETGTIRALPSGADLDRYTYLVAGCVGEFWTSLAFAKLRGYARLDEAAMLPLGVHFGKALQLVNILRDLPEDLRNCRCYLPEDELHAAGLTAPEMLEKPEAARPIVQLWTMRAVSWLDDARQYIAALRPARMRMACFLPWHLAHETLLLMRTQPPLETKTRVKVGRSVVRQGLFLALLAAFSDVPLKPPARPISDLEAS